MSDFDSLLRERLHAAAPSEVATEPAQLRRAIARRQRQIRRRRRAVGLLGLLVAVTITLGVGLLARDEPRTADVVTPPTDDRTGCGTWPRFRPAPGWEVAQGASSTTAANVALGPGTSSGDAPWDTVDRLTDGDVVLYAMAFPAADLTIVDPTVFPERDLPLLLDDADPGGLEGQPDDVWAERLTSQIDDWIVDIVIFYGNDPTGPETQPTAPNAETREATQQQLAGLEIAPPCPSAP